MQSVTNTLTPEQFFDSWTPRTLRDAYTPRPPVEYAVTGLFALPSLNIIYGAPGSLKSFLAADLALCIAAGLPWLPEAPWQPGAVAIPTRQAPVMWLDFDNGRSRTDDRFEALGRARNLPEDTPIIYYSMPAPGLDASNAASVGALEIRMQAAGTKVVIIDNLATVSGNADENSSEMGNVMLQFRNLAENTGAAVILIHHQRKGNGMPGRAGETLRGHSSIEAALDLALLVQREELADQVKIKATKARGADVFPFGAMFTYETGPDDQLSEARFFGLEAEDTTSERAIEKAVRSVLSDGALNHGKLVNAVREYLPDVGILRIRGAISRMETGKIITRAKGEKNASIYNLSSVC